MDLIELRDQILYYFESAVDLTDAVVVRAINSARKAAETQYAFEMNKRVLQASVDLRTGAAWSPLPVSGTVTPVYKVRSIKRAYLLSTDGGMTQIPFAYREHLVFDPTLSGVYGSGSAAVPLQKVYFVGDKIYFWPYGLAGTLQNVVLDAYIWMPDYKPSDMQVSDWMMDQGAEYLFWKTVWDLNFKKKEFVPRQEGNLQISLDNANMALQRLITWDGSLKGSMTSLNELL
jgi:hypothetical protein